MPANHWLKLIKYYVERYVSSSGIKIISMNGILPARIFLGLKKLKADIQLHSMKAINQVAFFDITKSKLVFTNTSEVIAIC